MRALICSFGTPGFLYPLVGLACELRRRGHHVAFASGRDTADTLAAAGFERIPRGDEDGVSFALERWGVPLAVAMDVKHVDYAVGRWQPDILIAPQLCHAPVIVRERTDIPLAVLGFAAYLWPNGADVPSLIPADRRAWRLRESMHILDDMRKLFGLAPREWHAMSAPLLGDLFMVRSVPAFEPFAASLPQVVELVGGCQWEPPGEGNAMWAETEGAAVDPIIYVQHGRSFRSPSFWPHLVDALADAPLRIMASVGRMDSRPTSVPANFFVRDHIPHGAVLPRAAAAISNGNSAVVLGALTHGVPQLVLPNGGETVDNADRLVAAECALRLESDELSADLLSASLTRLLESPSGLGGTRRMAAAFAQTTPFARAATLVESLAGHCTQQQDRASR